MVSPGKPDVDPCSSSEQDISETSTLTGKQDNYEPLPVPSEICGAPTNYLRVSRQGVHKQAVTISGRYFIDLSIPPVPRTVPHVVSGTENLFLHTGLGSVTADVWVTGNNKLGRCSMKLFTDNGSVRAKHDAFSGGEREHRPSLDIELRANSGEVSLSLPRCFRGLITIKYPQVDIAFFPALEKRTALLSEAQGVRVYFVGDRPPSWMRWSDDDDDKEGEEGAGASRYSEERLDELTVNGGHSGVRIRWDGEPGPF